MSIFDQLFTDDPQQAAKLALAAGLLGGKGNLGGILSRSLMDAQGVYGQASEAGLKRKTIEAQLRELQRKADEAAGQRTRTQQAADMFPQAQAAQGPPEDGGKYPMVRPTEDDYLNYAVKAFPLDPSLAQFGWKAAEGVASREDKQSAAMQAAAAQAAARKEQQAAADAARMERLREQLAAEDRLKRTLAAMRPERQEPAPTITTVIDPEDPKRMLTVNARLYKGGGASSPGVVGVAGREPTAALRESKESEGKRTLTEMLDTLRASYDTLDQSKEITSKDRSAVDNAMAWVKASPVGQLGGRIVGSEAQSERNKIAQTRPLLINAIKQATGMSAQQLNSNIELKTMLQAATDPSLDIEANRAAIDQLERVFIKGDARPAKPSGAPKAGDVMDGYRFKGGNPADKSNWEKVQ